MNDGFIYGLDEFYFKGRKLGYISEEGLKAGGDAPSTTSIRAAQARNAVVKNILTSPGTDRFDFTVIELKKENLVAVLGGESDGTSYTAPRSKEPMEGRAFIKCFSGHKIDIPKATLTSNLSGTINLADVLSIACGLEMAVPDDPDKGPFTIYDPEAEIEDDPTEAEG